MLFDALAFAARHGRWCLVLGLLAGLGLPDLAQALRPWLPELIAGLLLTAALRIGPRAAVGGLGDLGNTTRTILIFQFVLPMIVLATMLAFGVAAAPWALALVLLLSAPPVTGSPSFTVLLGRDPAVAMRLLLIGTALFPATALPILWLSPAVETVAGVLASALRLVTVIFGAVGVAFAIRHWLWPEVTPRQRGALDGASAILLAVVVIGLMSAVGPALVNTPVQFALWLGFACAVNFGAQILAARFAPLQDPVRDRTGTAIVAGNRNIALFLVALPEPTMDAVLLFIGCYQVPMYLTPIVMKHVIARQIQT